MLDERFGDYSVRWVDPRNYVLVKHIVGNDGSPSESQVGFYNKLDSCLIELAKRDADHCGSISDWLVRFAEVLEELRRAF